jgi:hypothetical protein
MLPLLLVALAAQNAQAPVPKDEAPVALQVRIFDGTDEVTANAKLNVYPAGDRTTPLEPTTMPAKGAVFNVKPGFYDVQVIRQEDGRVLSVRWTERLLVIHYPDEAGVHLQVINFKPGFGALQIMPPPGAAPGWSASAYPAGEREQTAGRPFTGSGYTLFVLPAGRYDVELRDGDRVSWLTEVDVPLDRTRLKHAPPIGRR